MYFPKVSKYISLFVQKEEGGDDKKAQARMKQARAAALKAWAEDQKAGNDRVAYAMEVERNGGGEKEKSLQISDFLLNRPSFRHVAA